MYSFHILFILVTFSGLSWAAEVYSCQNTTLTLECPMDEVINIENAYYGNADAQRCPSSNNATDNSSCQTNDANEIVRNICENHQNCSIQVDSITFDDFCPNVTKYLAVNYTCGNYSESATTECPKNEHIGIYCPSSERCPSSGACPDLCGLNRCVCDPGYNRDPNTNICILKAYCPLEGNINSTHEEFNNCATCQVTCRHPSSKMLCKFFRTCEPGYVCSNGFLRDCYSNKCVRWGECPRPYPRW